MQRFTSIIIDSFRTIALVHSLTGIRYDSLWHNTETTKDDNKITVITHYYSYYVLLSKCIESVIFHPLFNLLTNNSLLEKLTNRTRQLSVIFTSHLMSHYHEYSMEFAWDRAYFMPYESMFFFRLQRSGSGSYVPIVSIVDGSPSFLVAFCFIFYSNIVRCIKMSFETQ